MNFLKMIMRQKRLLIPYQPELANELNVESLQLTKADQIQYSHSDGTHDDRTWAVALGIYSTKRRVRGLIHVGSRRLLRISRLSTFSLKTTKTSHMATVFVEVLVTVVVETTTVLVTLVVTLEVDAVVVAIPFRVELAALRREGGIETTQRTRLSFFAL